MPTESATRRRKISRVRSWPAESATAGSIRFALFSLALLCCCPSDLGTLQLYAMIRPLRSCAFSLSSAHARSALSFFPSVATTSPSAFAALCAPSGKLCSARPSFSRRSIGLDASSRRPALSSFLPTSSSTVPLASQRSFRSPLLVVRRLLYSRTEPSPEGATPVLLFAS
jgi:hypothetical protein